MKRGILNLAIFAVLLVPANLFAAEKWEKKWMDDGWVRVKNRLMDRADTTWYGQKGVNPSRENWIFYIDSTGKRVYFVFVKGGLIHVGTRSEEGGKICTQWEDLLGGKKLCGRNSLWKKGEMYLTISKIGFEDTRWKMKKGNLENFK